MLGRTALSSMIFPAAFPAADHSTVYPTQRFVAVKTVSPERIDGVVLYLTADRCLFWSRAVKQGRCTVLDGIAPPSAAVYSFFPAQGRPV